MRRYRSSCLLHFTDIEFLILRAFAAAVFRTSGIFRTYDPKKINIPPYDVTSGENMKFNRILRFIWRVSIYQEREYSIIYNNVFYYPRLVISDGRYQLFQIDTIPLRYRTFCSGIDTEFRYRYQEF